MNSELDNLRSNLEEQLRFEMLLADLSARFVNVSADAVDREIEDAQRRIVEMLGLDRSTLFQIVEGDDHNLFTTHSWARPGMARFPIVFSRTVFPWASAQLMRGEMFKYSRNADLPPEAAQDAETVRVYGLLSNVTFPLFIGGKVFGALAFCALRVEREWPDWLVNRLRLAADVFTGAIDRQRTSQALAEGEAQMSLALASAHVGLWSLDVNRDEIWISKEVRALFAFPPGVPVTKSVFLGSTHPDDCELRAHAFKEALANGTDYKIEYRFLNSDGEVRWAASQGHCHRDAAGKIDRVVGAIIDITECKMAENRLRESEARFRTVADSAPVLIWMSGTDKLCNFFNQPWLDFTGRTLDQEMGNGWAESVHPDDLAGCLKMYLESFDARQPFVMQYRLKRHDGEYRWILDHGVPRFDVQGNFAGYIGSCVDVTERKQREEELQAALAEVKRLKDQLHQENEYLRQEVYSQLSQDKIAGQSPAIRRILAQVEQVAATDATVLLLGETGTGKEMIASAIHDRSLRRGKIMVRVNCAAIPTALIESELFGREKGAYTGALSRQAGRFELADHSTLFLDEVGELPADVQVKLLRVLEEKQIERLGSSKSVKVDVRIITATNKDLEKSVLEGTFRKDLYYRLNVFPIIVPPLRERYEDLPQLVWTFVSEFNKTLGKNIESISSESLKAIQDYAWPGNVRELRNVIERAMIISTGPRLKIEMPKAKTSGPVTGAAARSLTIKDTERDHILSVLEMTSWRIRGKNGAAEILEINPTTLESRMAKLGIHRAHK
jgi:formate hydrogenlyase transcriptional activator